MSNDQTPKLSKNLTEKFRAFITQHSPSSVNRHLRGLLLDYMIYQQKIGFPSDFDTRLWELSDLFDLLDCAANEWEHAKENRSS
jgi:hypothetical protein